MKEWFKARWPEPSTRAGIGTIAVAVGALSPTSAWGNIALAVGVALGGQAIVKPEGKAKPSR